MLNGLMMSTMSWYPLLGGLDNYKIYLLDFIDQGKSQKFDGKEYSQDLQKRILESFIHELDIREPHIIGTSYGGEVAIRYAIENSHKIKSLTLSNTTFCTNYLLQEIGRGWIDACEVENKRLFFKCTLSYIYSKEFYEERKDWLNTREEFFVKNLPSDWYEGIKRLIISAEDLEIPVEKLKNIKAPTMIISSDEDKLISKEDSKILNREIYNSRCVSIIGAGHAAMYEKPNEWVSIIKGFIENIGIDIKI
nr:alpha/beta hydrolase [Oceanirhabdus seepicola]